MTPHQLEKVITPRFTEAVLSIINLDTTQQETIMVMISIMVDIVVLIMEAIMEVVQAAATDIITAASNSKLNMYRRSKT